MTSISRNSSISILTDEDTMSIYSIHCTSPTQKAKKLHCLNGKLQFGEIYRYNDDIDKHIQRRGVFIGYAYDPKYCIIVNESKKQLSFEIKIINAENILGLILDNSFDESCDQKVKPTIMFSQCILSYIDKYCPYIKETSEFCLGYPTYYIHYMELCSYSRKK
jgi:hypothetical protein